MGHTKYRWRGRGLLWFLRRCWRLGSCVLALGIRARLGVDAAELGHVIADVIFGLGLDRFGHFKLNNRIVAVLQLFEHNEMAQLKTGKKKKHRLIPPAGMFT